VRRAYRPKTPEGAANSSYVHFLFGLIFKYEATTEQGHRSQGPNDTARHRRRGDRMSYVPALPPTLEDGTAITLRFPAAESLGMAS
jgi:hypothetical protein